MKLLEGTIYTRDLEKLAKALEEKGLTVHESVYDGRKIVNSAIHEGIANIYNLLNRVKIRTIISDDLLGTLMDTLCSFGDCKFDVISEEQICLA